MSATGEMRLDVHVPGEPVRRGVEVRVAPKAVVVGNRTLEFDDLLWAERRAGLLMLFSTDWSVAVRGSGGALDELAMAVAERVSREERRRRLRERLEGGEPRIVAGCAVVGRLEGEAIHGLRVAVVAEDGLHLVSAEGDHLLPFPVNEAGVVGARGERRALRLKKGESVVAVHYLTRDEEEDALELSRGRRGGEEAGSLEMFRQKDVAPPPAAEVPELSVAAESLPSSAEEEAAEIPEDLRKGAGLGPHFFETHFLELGEIALGPLLLRKSAASGARSLERALGSLDASELQEDTRAAVARAVGRMTEVFGDQLERMREERRAPGRIRDERELDQDELDRLIARVQAPFDKLAPRFRRLEEEQDRLATRLEALAEGPPGSDDTAVSEVADAWRRELRKLDRGYRSAWAEAVREVRRAWESLLLPRLGEVAEMSRRRIPEWAQLALLGLLTFLVVGALVLLLGG